MQDLLVTGFSERDENTVLYILARTHPGSRHVVLPRARKPGVASQEQGAYADSLCIVDLDGIGLAQHSPENERALMSFLAGRSAVLVTSHLPTWQSRRLPMLGEQAIAWLKHPFRTSDLLAAVRAVEPKIAGRVVADQRNSASSTNYAGQAQAPGYAADMAAVVPMPAWKRALALAEQLRTQAGTGAGRMVAASGGAADTANIPLDGAHGEATFADRDAGEAARASPVPDPVAAANAYAGIEPGEGANNPFTLASANLKALRECFPQIGSYRGMEVAEALVGSGGVLILRPPGENVGVQLMNLGQGWVASRMTALALRFITMDSGILSKIQLEPGDPSRIEAMLEAEFSGRPYTFHALDTLMWELMQGSLGQAELKKRGDIALRLVRFPNFNRLRNYAEFDIQLAAMCARGSVSLEQMEQAFPRRRFHIRRFAVAALAAGYVVAQPATSGVALSHGSSAKRGFFRALLEKLF